MAQQIIGIALLAIGILAYLFFGSYKGNLVSHTTLFYYLSVLVVLIGGVLWVTAPSKNRKR